MTVAVFDFDGTITHKDTLAGFLFFSFGYQKMLFGFLSLCRVLSLYKLGIISNDKAKEQLFSYFFKGMSEQHFENLCNEFSDEIEKTVRTEAIKTIQWHQEQKHRVIIVSASIYNWIKPWAKRKGINEVLATQIEIADGKLTGKFSSKNCNGAEKVNRLRSFIPNIHDSELYVYGDSKGDKELLEIATKPFYRSF